MKRVITAVILVPIVILALFKAPLWLFTLLVLGVALLAAKEYFEIAEKTGFKPMRTSGYVEIVLLFLSVAAIDSSQLLQLLAILMIALVALFALISFVIGMERESLRELLPNSAVSFMVLPYVAIPLALIVLQEALVGNGALLLLYILLLVWCGDVAAYYVGRAMGKHKLAPRISPGKTWEGAIASTVAATVISIFLFRFTVPIEHGLSSLRLWGTTGYLYYMPASDGTHFLAYDGPVWLAAIFGLSVNIAAQLGDLVESAMKRGADVKDSGTLLPGHGGVLDRIDALLFAVPVGWLFCQLRLQFMFR